MTTIVLIRHGQSVANLNLLFAGHFDADLSELGRAQAELTAEEVTKRFKIDSIYSSDLLRAYNTAVPIASKTGIEIIPDTMLREIFAGEWEGRAFDELQQTYVHDFWVWRNDIGNSRCTGGESTREVGERMLQMMKKIVNENEGKTVVVTTHAAAIRSLMAICSGKDFSVMKEIPFVTNASYSVLEVNGDSFDFVEVSRAEHLKDMSTKLPPNV
jgi:broad specificity phosphatase PhoE